MWELDNAIDNIVDCVITNPNSNSSTTSSESDFWGKCFKTYQNKCITKQNIERKN